MDPKYILDVPASANPDGSEVVSTFTPPIFIEMGDEGGEYLEAKVKEKTGENVKADKEWTHLSGGLSLDTSVVGGFMFQSDAGSGCSIQVTESGNRPVRILIDGKQDFGMFLVVVLRHETWTTSGEFYLRFLRRFAVSDKPCTARIEGPFAVPVESLSDTGTSSTEERRSSSMDAMDADDEKEEGSPDRTTSPSASPPAQTPPDALLDNAHVAPLAIRTRTSENEGKTIDGR